MKKARLNSNFPLSFFPSSTLFKAVILAGSVRSDGDASASTGIASSQNGVSPENGFEGRLEAGRKIDAHVRLKTGIVIGGSIRLGGHLAIQTHRQDSEGGCFKISETGSEKSRFRFAHKTGDSQSGFSNAKGNCSTQQC